MAGLNRTNIYSLAISIFFIFDCCSYSLQVENGIKTYQNESTFPQLTATNITVFVWDSSGSCAPAISFTSIRVSNINVDINKQSLLCKTCTGQLTATAYGGYDIVLWCYIKIKLLTVRSHTITLGMGISLDQVLLAIRETIPYISNRI